MGNEIRNAPRFIRGRPVALTDPDKPVRIQGGRNQAQIAISNPHASSSIYVRAELGGPIIQEIFNRTTWTIETASDLFLSPENNNNWNAYVAQTFYE